MRQKIDLIEVDYFSTPELVIKDNVQENGDIVCNVVLLSKEEQIERAKIPFSPDSYMMTDSRISSPEYADKFELMDRTSAAIGRVESVQQMKERFDNEESVSV